MEDEVTSLRLMTGKVLQKILRVPRSAALTFPVPPSPTSTSLNCGMFWAASAMLTIQSVVSLNAVLY